MAIELSEHSHTDSHTKARQAGTDTHTATYHRFQNISVSMMPLCCRCVDEDISVRRLFSIRIQPHICRSFGDITLLIILDIFFFFLQVLFALSFSPILPFSFTFLPSSFALSGCPSLLVDHKIECNLLIYINDILVVVVVIWFYLIAETANTRRQKARPTNKISVGRHTAANSGKWRVPSSPFKSI